jgi:hypothetical protein
MIPFEINITAYNYPGMVQSCVNQFRRLLPDSIIRVWDNSKIRTEYKNVNEVRWHRFNPSLSRVWNWAILQSESEWVLISNDDIELNEFWLRDLECEMKENPESLWHGPSRCFMFNKKLIELVGFFDENLTV